MLHEDRGRMEEKDVDEDPSPETLEVDAGRDYSLTLPATKPTAAGFDFRKTIYIPVSNCIKPNLSLNATNYPKLVFEHIFG